MSFESNKKLDGASACRSACLSRCPRACVKLRRCLCDHGTASRCGPSQHCGVSRGGGRVDPPAPRTPADLPDRRDAIWVAIGPPPPPPPPPSCRPPSGTEALADLVLGFRRGCNSMVTDVTGFVPGVGAGGGGEDF